MGLFHKHIMADSQKKLPTVPETLLKKRKQNAEFRAKRAKAALLMKKQNREKRKVMFKRAEKYVKEYRVMERDQIRLARQAKKHGNFYVPPQPKLALVIRIRGINGIHPRPRKVLQLFRLRQINNATFVRLNEATIHMLRIAEPYITMGIPQPEERTGTRLQAWIRQGRRPPCTPYRQRHRRERARQARYHLC